MFSCLPERLSKYHHSCPFVAVDPGKDKLADPLLPHLQKTGALLHTKLLKKLS